MLKRFRRLNVLLLGIFCVLGFSSACHASAAGPVIAQIQAGVSPKATQEFIVIHNNSTLPVDISGWCLVYSSSSDATKTSLGCFGILALAANNDAVAVSQDFKSAHPDTLAALTFSAGMNNNGGHIRLFNGSGTTKLEIDKVGWGDAVVPETLAAPAQLSDEPLLRKIDGSVLLKDTDNNRQDFIDTCSNINGNQNTLPEGYVVNSSAICTRPLCPNLKDASGNYLNYLPDGYQLDADGINCVPVPTLESATLLITELLPNSASTDTGNEFIELYNPNSRAVNLKGYKLELGPSFTKSYVLPDQMLAPSAYASFSDTQTGIVLPNTTATVRLTAPAGNIVDETDVYDTPADDTAWALIGGMWEFTNQPTPGAANLASVEDDGGGTADAGVALEPCPTGKFRNPDTNRCKTIDDATTSLTPCAADQERNPDTNRCRSVLLASSSLTPCQAGQERNPQTNRCRSITAAASANLTPCAANQERNPDTNRCRKKSSSATAAGKIEDVDAGQTQAAKNGWMITGGVVAAAAGYGAWEWRSEVATFARRFKGLFGKSPLSD